MAAGIQNGMAKKISILSLCFLLFAASAWAESPNCTTITTPNGGPIIDNGGNTWTFNSGGQSIINGVFDGEGTSITEEVYQTGGTIYALAGGMWFLRTISAGWSGSVSDQPPSCPTPVATATTTAAPTPSATPTGGATATPTPPGPTSTPTPIAGPTVASFVFPESFGATHDGKVFYNASMAGGSNSVVDTADAPFVPGDVGKLVCVSGVSNTWGPPPSASSPYNIVAEGELCGKITGYTSPSTISVSFASANTGATSGQIVRYGTDNTTALNNTLNSCATNGCTIWLGGPYATSGALIVPLYAPVNIRGNATAVSYGENNINQYPAETNGATAGIWLLTKSLSNTAAIIYGGTSSIGSQIDSIYDDLEDVSILGGTGFGTCTVGGHCDIGIFPSYQGGGTSVDGILFNSQSSITLHRVDVSNFSGNCLNDGGNGALSIQVEDSVLNGCNEGFNIHPTTSGYTPGIFMKNTTVQSMNLGGVLYDPYGGEEGDTLVLLDNVFQWNNVSDTAGTYNTASLGIENGHDEVVMGNWFETNNGGNAANCLNAGGGAASVGSGTAGAGSQLIIGNHYDADGCDNFQYNTQANFSHSPDGNSSLVACSQAWVGSHIEVTDGVTASCNAPGTTYTAGGGSQYCVIACTYNGSTYKWVYAGY